MSLSDKKLTIECIQGLPKDLEIYPHKDVREFIKDVKEELISFKEMGRTRIIMTIDTLAGSKLI